MDQHLSQYNKFLPTLRKINNAGIEDGSKTDLQDVEEMTKMKEIFATFGPKLSSGKKNNSNSKGRNKAGNYESIKPAPRRMLLNQDTSRESFGNHLRKIKSGER